MKDFGIRRRDQVAGKESSPSDVLSSELCRGTVRNGGVMLIYHMLNFGDLDDRVQSRLPKLSREHGLGPDGLESHTELSATGITSVLRGLRESDRSATINDLLRSAKNARKPSILPAY